MSTAVATTQPQHRIPSGQIWRDMMQMADALHKSGLLPGTIKTPAAALAIIQKGAELGVPPMYALSNIVVVQGRPTCQAELMAALVYRDHGDDALRITRSDNTHCAISYKRRNWTKPEAYTFTIEDAKAANLANKDTWKQYPAAMLRARCISAVCRMAFPDSIGGMYTSEEMGASVAIVDGEVQIIDTPAGHTNTVIGEVFPVPQQLPPSPRDNPPPTPIAGPVADVPDRGQANNYHDALYDTLAAAAHRHDGVERPALDLSVTSAEEVERSIKDLIKTLVRLPAIAGDTGVAMTQAQVDTILALKQRYTEAGVVLGSLPRMTEQGAAWLIDVLDSLAPLADEQPI